MNRWLTAVLFAVMMVPVTVAAQSGGRTCQYDLECGVGQACNEEGRCAMRGDVGEDEGADDECGTDRRCRIDRLKRKNDARRHADNIEEERQVRRMIEEAEDERLENFPRLDKPLSGDLRVSRLGALGVHLGYIFAGHIQPEFEFAYSSLSVFAPAEGSSSGLDGFHDGWWFKLGAAYFLLESWFSPYIAGGFVLGTGRYYSYDFGFFDSSGADLGTRYHAGEIGGGIDMQFKFGLHTRLGIAYRPLIYNQARIGPGQYDPSTRQGLASWFNDAVAIDVVWLLGWAI